MKFLLFLDENLSGFYTRRRTMSNFSKCL